MALEYMAICGLIAYVLGAFICESKAAVARSKERE